MEKTISSYINEWQLLTKKDRVIAGISGGADSVCLLLILARLRPALELELTAVHVHHGLRGADADADEAYVKELCEKLGVECVCFHEHADAYAVEHGLSPEEAGRTLRRQRFLQVCEQRQGTRIALAHHQNDNVETVLFHLCRGTGIRGAAGIPPKSGKWIHPLLCVSRAQIEEYLTKQGVRWREDLSNQEDTYTRNRLRNHVIPYLEAQVHPRAGAHIQAFTGELYQMKEYIDAETKRYAGICTRKDKNATVLLRDAFFQTPEALQPYILLDCLEKAAGRRKNLSRVHVRMLRELFDQQVGRRRILPYALVAERTYEGIRLEKQPDGKGKDAGRGPEERSGQTADAAARLFGMRVFEKTAQMQTFPQNPYTKWFDYDIISQTVTIRHRRPGDIIVIDRDGHRQKLRRYLIDQKVPQKERDRVWLAADGSRIMWIVGYRQSQEYQVTDHTRRILEITFYGGEDDGRDSESIDSGGGCGQTDL